MTSNPVEPVDRAHPPHPTDTTSLVAPLKKQSKPKWLLGFLSLFLLAGVSYYAYQQLQQQQRKNHRPPIVPLERRNISITVSANGTVQPEQVINISPKTAGILKSLQVKEGDSVTKGQVLAHMDDSNLQGQLIQEEGRLGQAQADLRKFITGNRPQDIAQAQARLEALTVHLHKLIAGNRTQDIAQAQARLDLAQANLRKTDDDFRRTQNLYTAGAVSLQSLNQKRADRDSAQAQVTEAQQALSLQKVGTRTEDIEQARADVKQQEQALALLKAGTRTEEIDKARAVVKAARGSLLNIQTQMNDTHIRAPFDGVVLRKYANPGAFVTPMTAGSSVSSATSSSILALADTNQVVANVAERNISQVRVNQQVVIKADAYPGKTFTGIVSQIAAQSTVEQNVTSFEVKVALASEAKKLLRSGMNVSAEFKVGELQNALTVPTIAVTRQQNVAGVYVVRKNQPPVFTPITTGATVNNRTEVKAGLNGTEHVLMSLPPSPEKKSGLSFPGLPGSKNEGPQEGPPGPPPGGGAPPH
ncbi:efflux RND transporter periplasmic adaptor subunit [Iningainema tapete]|uniref:Efflux RND transporter periplasmic adaptor subunit n=1 Tax=Iningainema tapete BLCC-T55 TaxID=2748662 RepID=A0A8J6XGS2_9CYAN|nr:efflux RND transporter periplasmic adaptor subunit [Iningainema tapete]MBD2776510.1 efflux RND transporter periplasmic adaptor subunit [Iningainema tapete BLCC-T55]